MTKPKKQPEVSKREPSADELDAELDEALKGTFPASDPVALSSRLKPGRPAKPDKPQKKRPDRHSATHKPSNR